MNKVHTDNYNIMWDLCIVSGLSIQILFFHRIETVKQIVHLTSTGSLKVNLVESWWFLAVGAMERFYDSNSRNEHTAKNYGFECERH